MLSINTEFRKGIFFIRLNGVLTKDTIDKFKMEVTDLIKDSGIKNILVNLNNLNEIDNNGIEELYYNFKLCKSKKGIGLICGINSEIEKDVKPSNYIKIVNSELCALNMI